MAEGTASLRGGTVPVHDGMHRDREIDDGAHDGSQCERCNRKIPDLPWFWSDAGLAGWIGCLAGCAERLVGGAFPCWNNGSDGNFRRVDCAQGGRHGRMALAQVGCVSDRCAFPCGACRGYDPFDGAVSVISTDCDDDSRDALSFLSFGLGAGAFGRRTSAFAAEGVGIDRKIQGCLATKNAKSTKG